MLMLYDGRAISPRCSRTESEGQLGPPRLLYVGCPVVGTVTYRGGAVGVGGVFEYAGVACGGPVPPEEQLSRFWR